ncbi:TonB-dependent receptor domain-containing protein [Telmatospirillum sp.]|uniref:TonB-dependent receptor plug domain-containing protein n=1 Tax=Telmatospirillum sp. TaxID=2079197 RepID=UPI00284A33B8|nr:TonB-dependent receptor [Telmatospirillum sp.]MDR3435566.1 TonB-dependent receptor [Telmatospirillum sp.]
MTHRGAAAIVAYMILISHAARGETIDYGAAQDLFGEPITTGATGTPQRLSTAPMTMDIVTSQDIRHSGATTLPEILSRLCGVDVYTWSNNAADVAIRGLNQGASNRLLVMVNGRETYTDALGVVLWENIPVRLDEIRQIEVTKGPNSALYGFNAGSGVINIVTFNPQYDRTNAERVTFGSDGSQAFSAVRTTQWENGGLRLSGGWTKDPETDFHPLFAGDRLAASSPSINRTINLDSQMAPDDQTEIRVQGALTDGSMRGMYVMPFYIDLMMATGSIEYARESDIGHLEASLMHNRFTVGQYRNSLATGSLSNDVTVAKLQDRFKVGSDDTVRVGTEYRRDDMPTFPLHSASLASQDIALDGMWNHAFDDNLSLLNALRGDRYQMSRTGAFPQGTPWTNEDYDRSIFAWSYNSALVWRPTAFDSWKISAARGQTLPSLSEFGVLNPLTIPFNPPSLPTAQLLSVGNPHLQPTRINHYEISWEHALGAIAGSTRLSAYHQTVSGLRDFSATTLTSLVPVPTLLSTYVNSGGAHLKGLEWEIKGRLGDVWRWNANYSAEVVSDETDMSQYHNFSRSTPRHKANVSLGWTFGRWEGDTFLRYVSGTEMPEQVAFGVYGLTPVKDVVAVSQRLAFAVTSDLRIEATAYSAFADNPVAGEKRRVLFSVIANY